MIRFNVLLQLLFAGWVCFALCSCSGLNRVRTVTKRKVDTDFFGNEHNFKIGKDEAGRPKVESDQRSSFESKAESSFGGGTSYQGSEFSKKSYRKKRWGGNSSYDVKSFAGRKQAANYSKEPWFVRNQAGAAAQGKEAKVAKKGFLTRVFGTSTAREQGAGNLDKPSNYQTDVRREVYKQPDVIHWKEQQGLSINDTKQLLAR